MADSPTRFLTFFRIDEDLDELDTSWNLISVSNVDEFRVWETDEFFQISKNWKIRTLNISCDRLISLGDVWLCSDLGELDTLWHWISVIMGWWVSWTSDGWVLSGQLFMESEFRKVLDMRGSTWRYLTISLWT